MSNQKLHVTTAISTLLQWSGAERAVSLSSACISLPEFVSFSSQSPKQTFHISENKLEKTYSIS